MGLKIMKGRDGRPRETWYARFTRNGQKVDVNLLVAIRGTVPVDAEGHFDPDGEGDAAFRQSRAAALKAFAKMQAKAKTTGDAAEVKEAKTAAIEANYYRARTGKSIKTPLISELADYWQNGIVRTYTPTPERVRAARMAFTRFADFTKRYCAKNDCKCERIGDVTTTIAAAYFKHLFSLFAWGTVRDQISILSGTYAFVMGLRARKVNGKIQNPQTPFNQIIKRNREIGNAKVERRPLTQEELARLFDVTGENTTLHGLVVCAACTGMRIGDVCHLKWADVDLRAGLIDCVTAKAGVRVTLPIFAPLRMVLDDLNAKRAIGDSPFVFPVQAAQYDHVNAKGYPDQRTGIVRMVKPYFARAVFPDAEPEPADVEGAEPMPTPDVLALIEGARFTAAKKEKVREVFTRFRNGEQCAAIAAALNMHRGQVSAYLQDVEKLTGETYRPRIERKRNGGFVSAHDLIERTRQTRQIGKCSASLFGWHNLRHSFVSLALQAGVPVNDVSRIVGHGDVETTLRNYGNTSKEVVAERTRQRMSGTVLETGTAHKAIGETVDVPTDGTALAPVKGHAAIDVTPEGAAALPAPAKPDVDELIAAMSDDQKKELARKLLGL